MHQLKDGSQNWQDSEIEPGKLSHRAFNRTYETRQRKGNQYGWERHLHGVEVPLAYVTVERNPSGGVTAVAPGKGKVFFLKMVRYVRFRADLKTLYVGPALGPLTRAAH